MAVAMGLAMVAGLAVVAMAHDLAPGAKLVHSEAGTNAWNGGKAPADWYGEIQRYHGHVGPWNVLGWRIGQAALREMKSEWGKHELEVVCYVPPQTPFTCLVDGLSVGTGNSLGRLDLRLAEVLTRRETFVAVFNRVTLADWITAWEMSRTVPRTVLLLTCGHASCQHRIPGR